jgi:hypothetical protein
VDLYREATLRPRVRGQRGVEGDGADEGQSEAVAAVELRWAAGAHVAARHPGAARVPGRAALAAGGRIRVVGPEALPAGGIVRTVTGRRGPDQPELSGRTGAVRVHGPEALAAGGILRFQGCGPGRRGHGLCAASRNRVRWSFAVVPRGILVLVVPGGLTRAGAERPWRECPLAGLPQTRRRVSALADVGDPQPGSRHDAPAFADSGIAIRWATHLGEAAPACLPTRATRDLAF